MESAVSGYYELLFRDKSDGVILDIIKSLPAQSKQTAIDEAFSIALYDARIKLLQELFNNGFNSDESIYQFLGQGRPVDKYIADILIQRISSIQILRVLLEDGIYNGESLTNIQAILHKLPKSVIDDELNIYVLSLRHIYNNSREDILELFLKAGADPNSVELEKIIGLEELVKILTILSPMIDLRRLEMYYIRLLPNAITANNYPLVEFILNQKRVILPMDVLKHATAQAAQEGNYEIVQLLFGQDFESNEDFNFKRNILIPLFTGRFGQVYAENEIDKELFNKTEIFLRVYDPFYPKASKLLQSVNFASRYPGFTLSNAFTSSPLGTRKNPDLAIKYLEDEVAEEFAPGTDEAKKNLDQLNYRTGKLTLAQYQTGYEELINTISKKLLTMNSAQLCGIVLSFNDRFELDGPCNTYSSEELIEAINRLIVELDKLSLFRILT